MRWSVATAVDVLFLAGPCVLPPLMESLPPELFLEMFSHSSDQIEFILLLPRISHTLRDLCMGKEGEEHDLGQLPQPLMAKKVLCTLIPVPVSNVNEQSIEIKV